MNKNILILGAQGMLGHTIYNYLIQKFPDNVWGTSKRKSKKFYSLRVSSFEHDFFLILKDLKIDYVINCIALLESKSKTDLQKINTDFPKKLANFMDNNKIKLIHISTDAVFGKTAGIVSERDNPQPDDDYGISKFNGEPAFKNTLSIRTSILGFDQRKKKGLLEWFLSAKDPKGYTNHWWSGATTLQLAQFIESVITRNLFEEISSITQIIHFAPLNKLTKYEILRELNLFLKQKKQIEKFKSKFEISRQLTTVYAEEIELNSFTNNLNLALQELILFERIQI